MRKNALRGFGSRRNSSSQSKRWRATTLSAVAAAGGAGATFGIAVAPSAVQGATDSRCSYPGSNYAMLLYADNFGPSQHQAGGSVYKLSPRSCGGGYPITGNFMLSFSNMRYPYNGCIVGYGPFGANSVVGMTRYINFAAYCGNPENYETSSMGWYQDPGWVNPVYSTYSGGQYQKW